MWGGARWCPSIVWHENVQEFTSPLNLASFFAMPSLKMWWFMFLVALTQAASYDVNLYIEEPFVFFPSAGVCCVFPMQMQTVRFFFAPNDSRTSEFMGCTAWNIFQRGLTESKVPSVVVSFLGIWKKKMYEKVRKGSRCEMPNGQEENCGGWVLFEKSVYQELLGKKLDGTDISRNRIEVHLPTPRIGSLIFCHQRDPALFQDGFSRIVSLHCFLSKINQHYPLWN